MSQQNRKPKPYYVLAPIAEQRGYASVDAMMTDLIARRLTAKGVAEDLGVQIFTVVKWLRKNHYVAQYDAGGQRSTRWSWRRDEQVQAP